MKNNKVVIWLAIAGTLGAGIFLFLKFVKNNKKEKSGDALPNSPAANPVKSVSPSEFPLKKGSAKSELVRQLQALLGVTADGIFGSQTEAALLAKAGKTQIASQSEFDSVVNKLKSGPEIAANIAKANRIVSAYNSNPAVKLVALQMVKGVAVTQDTDGILYDQNVLITLQPNKPFAHDAYVPISSTIAGKLLFKIVKGDLQGLYKIDPNFITTVV